MFAAHINKRNSDILRKCTQRKLLGVISRLFDPPGNNSTCHIVMKLKLQETGRIDKPRDEELHEDFQPFVGDWTTNTADLNEIQST